MRKILFTGRRWVQPRVIQKVEEHAADSNGNTRTVRDVLEAGKYESDPPVEAFFHSFSLYSDGTETYPIAIVEKQSGLVCTALLEQIIFMSDDLGKPQ